MDPHPPPAPPAAGPTTDQIAESLTALDEAMWRMAALLRTWASAAQIESAAAHRLLAVIERLPGVRTTDIARYRGVSLSTVSRQIDRLVQLGLVAVQPDECDQRVHRLHTTEAGLRSLQDVRDATVRRVAGQLDPDRVRQLVDITAGLPTAVRLLDGAHAPAGCGDTAAPTDRTPAATPAGRMPAATTDGVPPASTGQPHRDHVAV